MTAPRLLLRTLHTTARAAQASASTSIAPAASALPAGVKEFTPKGNAVPLRPKREARVTLPSGYPEPPRYPPPAEYFAELDEIDAQGDKPKRHPLWAFFHVPASQTGRPDGTPPANLGSVDMMEEEEEGLASGELRGRGVRREAAGRAPRAEVVGGGEELAGDGVGTLDDTLGLARKRNRRKNRENDERGVPAHHAALVVLSVSLERCPKATGRYGHE